MKDVKRRVGLYGGTFSPPHLGHLHAAREFVKTAQLDSLVIMPAGIPPHKQMEHYVSGDIRAELCRLTFDSIGCAAISDFEITKEGKSYTVETLRHMSADDTELFLLCGDDMFLTLDTWYCAEEIFSRAVIVLMRRYDSADNELIRKKAEYEAKYDARVLFSESEAYPVSSTEIRGRLLSDSSCTGLLEEKTERFIRERGLYSKKDTTK